MQEVIRGAERRTGSMVRLTLSPRNCFTRTEFCVNSSHIIGPAIFGVVCVNTLSTAPSVLFFVATAFTAIAFVTLGFVRSPSQHLPDSEDGLDDHTSPIGTSPSH